MSQKIPEANKEELTSNDQLYMDEPLVSIITINFNQINLTLDLLKSLEFTSYKNKEIIVVDNNSDLNPKDILNEKFPYVNVIVSSVNHGFAGGNNLGIKEAKGEYLLFINNDTEVDPNFIEPLVKKLQLSDKIGMVSPKIIYHGTDNIIQYAGATAINKFTGRGKKIGHAIKDDGQFDQDKRTQLAHGAAMMVPSSVIKRVGMMPEVYFLYYEEHDWCEMIKRAGYEIHYVANSKVYHKESMSIGKKNPFKTYYMTRNRLLFMRRNTYGVDLMIGYLFFAIFSFPKNIITFLLKRESDHLNAFLKGVFWNFKINS